MREDHERSSEKVEDSPPTWNRNPLWTRLESDVRRGSHGRFQLLIWVVAVFKCSGPILCTVKPLSRSWCITVPRRTGLPERSFRSTNTSPWRPSPERLRRGGLVPSRRNRKSWIANISTRWVGRLRETVGGGQALERKVLAVVFLGGIKLHPPTSVVVALPLEAVAHCMGRGDRWPKESEEIRSALMA